MKNNKLLIFVALSCITAVAGAFVLTYISKFDESYKVSKKYISTNVIDDN